MSKHVSPLLGYNNNVRHKNRVFHIQTEDSGIKHPHIITHLFMDGGRILKSVKRSYAEHVGAEKMQETVKAMMKEQHKAMFIALRDGQFDHLLGDDGAKKDKDAKAEEKTEKPAEVKPEPPAAKAKSIPPPKTQTQPAPPPVPGDDDDDMVPMTTRNPELTLDIEALERAAASAPGGVPRASDLPPPHPNIFRENKTSGAYRANPPAPEVAGKRSGGSSPPKPGSNPPKKPASSPPKGKQAAPPAQPTSEARYAAARPAAIFGQARPQQGSSIFGEDLISDKSLDEVILSYLAEDLEPPADKKK